MKITTIRKIALDRLEISPDNVRKTTSSAEADAGLAASIAAHGLKQNIGVSAGEGDRFLVHAGGRRLRALQSLKAAGVIDGSYKVPCVIEEGEDASEMSLVENTMRVAMHPADEFEAFARLIDQGVGEEEVAGRFGTTIAQIRRRMKLAGVAPQILAAYRAGEITLDAVMAFTLSDSHDRQIEVLGQVKASYGYYGTSPAQQIKAMLNETRVSAGSRLGRLVSVERYEAEGGTITRDLFAEKDNVFFDDSALLESVARSVLEETAADLRTRWKWAEVMIDVPYTELRGFGRVYPEPVDLDPAIAEEFDTVDARLAVLAESAEASEEEAEYDRLSARAVELETLMEDARQEYSPEAMAVAGCLVSVNYAGAISIEAGLVKPGDIPQPERVIAAGESDDGEPSVDETDDHDDSDDASTVPAPRPVRIEAPAGHFRTPASIDPDAAPVNETGYSAALAEDLSAMRHQILRAHLAGDFETAFDLNLYALCKDVFSSGYAKKPVDVRVTAALTHGSREYLSGTVAEKMLEAQKSTLRLDWLPLIGVAGFDALCALTTREKQALFAYATAQGLAKQISIQTGADPIVERAGQRMNVDVAACWRPTAANYFGRVKKGMSLDVARELIGDQWAHDHAGDKKALLAEAMELAFSENARERAGLQPETAQKTARWLPAGMAFQIEGGDADVSSLDEVGKPDALDEAAEADELEEGRGKDDDDVIPAFLTDRAA
ncbi:ParB N-terminal domain-containing protein [Aurantimonas sp. C2-6-R+9]|uniref:ParB/RepB/Spo0J family partition protein n=1 Tax=unclassified Aurantimonas TaxID=2638230 RepID=UPI002E175405|nr:MULTISPECIES: ParB N-terminal domain-containing protein [unclassified Aurantimonas]MEC5292954.1 ParB N-terminal domain-containing protein [Aurantimonas sp. C2-3-R2]MEC5383237.1 ParB N-terminal domain-containing protein [Aurantimonas sp. C2-6-R+9]MEC5413979.1 ParB N-terminal domain-containing protein [Aurantimonas sp. C2-4-R8]